MLADTTEIVETLVLPDLMPYVEDKDPNRRTHIINPPSNLHIWQDGMTTQEIVDIARMHGYEIVALCGYVFVPKHNPEKYDACETCVRVAGFLMEGNGE